MRDSMAGSIVWGRLVVRKRIPGLGHVGKRLAREGFIVHTDLGSIPVVAGMLFCVNKRCKAMKFRGHD